MGISRWQKQNKYFWEWVWGLSAAMALLVVALLMALGYGVEVAGGGFLITFFALRIVLAFVFKNRFANVMVRVLKLNYEEIERDFRWIFKEKHVNFKQSTDEESYSYEFPWRKLNMTVQPHWVSPDKKPVTRVTLHTLNAKNMEFAEMLAEAIDEMEQQRLATKMSAT